MIVSGLYELIENHCKGTKKFWDLQIFHEGRSEKYKIVLGMQSWVIYLQIRQQECHVLRQRKYTVLKAYITILELDGLINIIFLGMIDHGFQAFGITIGSLDLHRRALSLVPNQEIQFYTSLLMVIVQRSAHLSEHIRYQILEDSTLVNVQVTLQDIELRLVIENPKPNRSFHTGGSHAPLRVYAPCGSSKTTICCKSFYSTYRLHFSTRVFRKSIHFSTRLYVESIHFSTRLSSAKVQKSFGICKYFTSDGRKSTKLFWECKVLVTENVACLATRHACDGV